MTQRRPMIDPPIEELLLRVDSRFTLVTVASRRARQINAYFNQLGDGLGSLVPPQVASTSRKPLSIALEEIAQDKVTFVRTAEGQAEVDGQGGPDASQPARPEAAAEVPAV